MENTDVEPVYEAVSRGLVHRRAISEVYLTESARLQDGSFSVQGQWPRRHHFFRVEEERVDLVLAAETLRQATILVAHRYYSVPLGQSFLMGRLEVHLLENQWSTEESPTDFELVVTVDNVRGRTLGPSALRTTVSFSVCGHVFATGVGELQILDPRLYARMRPTSTRSDHLPPSDRFDERAWLRGVSLAPLEAHGHPSWIMNIDVQHPVFFDHPLDHVPGMVVIEAVRQAHALSGSPLRAFDGRFHSFLDLDPDRPVVLRGALPNQEHGGSVEYTVWQSEARAATIKAA